MPTNAVNTRIQRVLDECNIILSIRCIPEREKMKEQKLYMCEYCGTQYKEKNKALDCEYIHKDAKNVKDAQYHAGGDYPDRVEITFHDGTSRWYKK